MKDAFILLPVCFLVFTSCAKQDYDTKSDKNNEDSASVPFINYTIKQGAHYCDSNAFVPVEYAELKFIARFDSSAIYTTVDPSNQYDINKLYGFSDNKSAHQDYSARFGWRWSDRSLRIFAYVYNNGVRTAKELGITQPGAQNRCSIKIAREYYIFSLNSTVDTMPRSAATGKGAGYRLYPYFGGDEAAPHDIHIQIKEMSAM